MKRLSWVLVFAMAAALLASPGALAAKKITIMASGTNAPYYEYVGKAFTKKYGADVEVISQAYDLTHEKIVTSQAGGSSAYDIAVIDTIYVANYAVAGFIEALDKYATPEQINANSQSSLDMLQHNGHTYALGGGYEYKYFFYNDELLKKAGFDAPPKTWSELVHQAKVMQDKGIAKYGIAWGWSQAEGLICDYTLLLNDFGGKFQDDSGKFVVNSPEAVKTLQFMVDTLSKDKIADPSSTSLTDREVMNLFLRGDIPFVINWSFGWSWVKDSAKSDVYKVAKLGLIPGVESAGTVSSTTGGGSGAAILSSSNNKELAWKFVEMYDSPEMQKTWLTDFNANRTTLKEVAASPAMDVEPYPDMVKQQAYAYPRAKVTWYPQFSKTLQEEIHRALIGGKTPQQALNDAQKRIDVYARQFGN